MSLISCSGCKSRFLATRRECPVCGELNSQVTDFQGAEIGKWDGINRRDHAEDIANSPKRGEAWKGVLWLAAALFAVWFTRHVLAPVEHGEPLEAFSSSLVSSLVEHDIRPGVKRHVLATLVERVSETDLRRISEAIRLLDNRPYRRTFISYRIEGEATDGMYWAMAEFDPELELTVLGITAEQYAQIHKRYLASDTGRTLGVWVDLSPIVGGRVRLFELEGRMYVETRLGHVARSEEVRGSTLESGVRLEPVEVNNAGDHWFLSSSGELEIRDSQGLIARAKRLRVQ